MNDVEPGHEGGRGEGAAHHAFPVLGGRERGVQGDHPNKLQHVAELDFVLRDVVELHNHSLS